MRLQQGATRVAWHAGAVVVEHDGVALLLDAPPGVHGALGDARDRLQGVVLTSGRIGTVGGLLSLLAALEPARSPDAPLVVQVLLGEERGAMLAEAWVRGWPDSYPLSVDAVSVGSARALGPFRIETVEVRTGEPVWRQGTVRRVPGSAVRVATPDATVAWVPGAAPGRAVARACAGADLAIVEVGRAPWPRTGTRWRLSLAEALNLADGAKEVWPVFDDGSFGIAEAH